MTEALPLLEIGLILLAAAAAGTLSRRLGLPAVLGYLMVGLVVGPFTPGYVADRHQIQLLADVGVVLLLFEVGIELDLRTLRREPLGIVAATCLQVALGVAIGMVLLSAFGVVPLGGATLALAAALSSSVVVINITRSRRRTTDLATERALVVWAVLQDIMTLVAAAVLTVLLFPGSDGGAATVAKLIAFVALVGAVHTFAVPRVLRAVRAEGDTFLISTVAIALSTAALGSVIFAVPIALAAFVAGLALSTRPEAAEARREVLPFRDLFAVMFFVGVGTLVDPASLPANILWLAIAIGLVVLKVGLVAALARVFHIPARPLQLGVGLGQLGEVSFVVLGLGVSAGVVTSGQFAAFLSAAVLTIAISAVSVRLFPRTRQHADAIGSA
ncbi:MAG: cation:proton antiporter [Chloroflexota bacterium]|nr:cation:proton antiporter [Chloroflexota bacterium]